MNAVVLAAVCCLAAVQAFPSPPSEAGMPGFDLLPANAQEKLKALFENKTLGWEGRHEKMFEILDSLPDEIKSKLPFPKCFEKLPQDVQDQLKTVQINNTLSWKEKLEKIRSIIDNLPEEIKQLLPLPPLPPGFELLPEDIQAKIKVVQEDKTMTHRERFAKIHEIMESLPADLKSKLPSALSDTVVPSLIVVL